MSDPLYHVGQDVAVCAPDLSIVIPITKIIAHEFHPDGVSGTCGKTGNFALHCGGHYYLTDSDHCFIHETYLRPYLPGEYLSSALNTQSPVEVNA